MTGPMEYSNGTEHGVNHYYFGAHSDPKFYGSLCDEIVGFLRSGLFGLSRHPNFAAEMAIWLVL